MVFHVSVIIFALIVAVFCIEGSYLLSYRERKMKRLSLLRLPGLSDTIYSVVLFGLIALGQMIFFVAVESLMEHYFASAEGYVPGLVMIIINACCSGAAFLRLWSGNINYRRLAKRCAFMSVALLLCEIFLFNGKSLASEYNTYTIPSASIHIDTEGSAEITDEGNVSLRAHQNTTLIFSDLPEDTHVISMVAEQEEGAKSFRTELKMKDDNFSDYYQLVSDKYVTANGYPCEFTIRPYGELRSIQMIFTDVTRDVTIKSITAMNCIPFRFSMLRFTVVFAILTMIIGVVTFGLGRTVYNRSDARHRVLVVVTAVLCVFSAMIFAIPEQELIEYSKEISVQYFDPYVQTFDAFQKGRVWIDIPVDENLSTLESVYDADVLGKSGFQAPWDRAYFEGKYYSYFGITPVILLYYPFYFITGALPTLEISNWIFSTLAILTTCLAVLAAVRVFVKKPNLLLLLLLLPTVTCMVGVYYCLQVPNMYDVVVASGLWSLMLAIWLGLRTCFTERTGWKLVQLFGCGLALGLCAGSRPSMTIGGLVLVPVFLSILFDKNQKFLLRLAQAAAFLVPVAACAAGLMYYNVLRFGSPFDFGANYQLTVSDIHANHIRPSAIFPAIYHYFIQPFSTSNQFPYIRMWGFYMGNYGMYAYTDAIVGALNYPLILMGTLLIPRSMRMEGIGIEKMRRRGFIIGCFLLAAGIAWADFCLAGVHIRYIFDIMPLLLLGSVCTVLSTTNNPRKMQYKLATASIVISAILVWMILILERGATLNKVHPNLYELLEDLIVFWQ